MEERTINDASTIGGIPQVQSDAALVEAEGTISDAKTIGGSSGLQSVEVSYNGTVNDDEPVLAEIDQFALIKKLGEGAAGKVYMAYDRETKLKVAVKGLPISMSTTAREAIKANFRTVVNLNHPNIASAREYHVIRAASYNDGATAEDFKMQVGDALLVMEYAEGKTLAAWRSEQSAIDQRTILEIVRQIAGALDEAHRQEIIHRDVKPANININIRPNGEPEVKLLDFGIAAEGMGEGVAGTRTYMAPEQTSGGRYTASVDIYALAKVTRELLTGSPNGENDSRLDTPERSVIARALSDDPQARYKSGKDFYEDLENAILEGGIKLPPEYRELLRTFNSEELSDSEKFDSYADSLNEFARETVRLRKVSTQFTSDYDIYRFLFTDAELLRLVDRVRSRRYRRRRDPSSVKVSDVMARGAFKAACEGVAFLSGNPMPDAIRSICDSISYPPEPQKQKRTSNLKSITLSITRIEEPVFYGCEVDSDNIDEEFKVDPLSCGVLFAEFMKVFREGDKVLITNPVESGETWQGSELVLEPDFLLSPQALGRASVWGQGSLMYLLSAFAREWKASTGTGEDSPPPKYRLMLGNMGDDCLAEEVAGGSEPQASLTAQFVEANALDAVAHEVDGKWKEEAEFIRQNIHREISQNMPNEFGVQPDQWQIEAPFVSPVLGVAGRMDAFAPAAAKQGRSVVFELKSGKWNTYRKCPKDEHLYQPWLYGDMLFYSLGTRREDVWPRLYYAKRVRDWDNRTREGCSFAVTTGRDNIRTVVNFRNKVVNVWRLMRENKLRSWFDKGVVRPDSFRAMGCGDTLWEGWLKSQAEELVNPILKADPLAKDYFWRFLAFEAAEDFCAWCGEGERSGGKCLSWKMALPEKQQAGMVYSSLVPESHALDAKGRVCRIDFDRAQEPTNASCSLREGDSVFLYEQTTVLSNPSNSRVFGGYVDAIGEEDGKKQIRICLDPPQTQAVFTPDPKKRYIVEASLANRGKNEYKGLFMFLAGCPRRRQLLLDQVKPYCDPPQPLASNVEHENEIVTNLVSRARAARDWFLIWGPPGTGKTRHLLRCYVEQVMATSDENVLMLAYTNRAVDEICDMLEKAGWDYWRIGAISHCKPKYREHIPGGPKLRFPDRESLLKSFENIKIVVGTIASLGADHSILHLGKRFDSAIVDEASQVLEPQLLSLFCAPDDDAPREPLIGKFVLVGDDKQLPAVVQQSVGTSAVQEESLRTIHLTNCRNSLFMRLKELSGLREELFGKMGKQYRMHEDIASFPNKYFYEGLEVGDIIRQKVPLPPAPFRATPFEKYILSTRLGFFPVIAPEIGKNTKSNEAEAFVCAEAVRVLLEKGTKYAAPGRDKLTPKDIGIIAPFRSQLATIRSRLEKILPDPAMVQDIMVDTVERYQGSERPVIIFSAVVSKKSQFSALSPTDEEDRRIESDKKLNVALTRAQEQFFLIGDRRLLLGLPSYKALIDEIETSYGAHYPKEPLAKYMAVRKAEEMVEAVAQEHAESQGSEPSAAQQQAENLNPMAQPGGKKKSLWRRILNFFGVNV